ncbi:hypothetical protein K440DRAFT_661052 [Wilcoxina mikolae CBS 423.85]|nr:hypothetical protein K440DRAFT_661052 [Wilcoxina mikolae CBS 423.85]
MARKSNPNPSKSKSFGLTVPVTTDPRFSIIHNDKRFALPKQRDTSLTIDARFRSVLSDLTFSSKAPLIDRYGRQLLQERSEVELSRFYRLASHDEEEEVEDKVRGVSFDPARGDGVVDASSESGRDDEDAEVGLEEWLETKAVAEAVVLTGTVSRRLASVNLDWDNVRAVDLMKAFSSFAPSGGKVLKVAVYPSAFGRQRMQREEFEGPPREIFQQHKVIDADENVSEPMIVKEDKGEEFDSVKLRMYLLQRLRYYYAIVECDSEQTAQHIYENCDGAEYEATANFFDLRFVPDQTSFDDDEPRDECQHDPTDYTPVDFVTDALQHSKVKLTWDEDDAQRKQVSKKAFSRREFEETELKAYLASDSDSDVGDEHGYHEKYQALLCSLVFSDKTKHEPTGEIEVTFTSGLDEEKDGKVIEHEETTIEKYCRKEKQRREMRRVKMTARKERTSTGDESKLNIEPKAEPEEPDRAAVEMGFNDHFFHEPVQSNPELKKLERQKGNWQKRREKENEDSKKASKLAELGFLMGDDDNLFRKDGNNVLKLGHFDMKLVVKAANLKKSNESKRMKRIREAEGQQEGFEMDIQDPRFAAVFERHDFAIDPTNPRFIPTEGTQKLMEERRKRSATREGWDAPNEEDRSQRKRKKTMKVGKRDELQSLVQSLKKRSNMADV